MSRIVKEAKLIGTKNNVELWLMHIDCDTMQDLPAANAYGSGTLICIGSTAHIIEDNATLEINSAGNWIQQQAGSSTYTRAEIDALLSVIDAENTSQQAEINYAINTGSKNQLVLTESSETTSGINWTVDKSTGLVTAERISGTSDSTKLISVFVLKAGNYTFTSHPNASFSASDSFIQLGGVTIARDVDGFQNFTLTQDSEIRVSCRVRTGVTAADFKPMIRSTEIIDPMFQPYAPTNRQLYLMILALSSP